MSESDADAFVTGWLGASLTAALAAREAIREVAYRYARGVDRLDADVMRSAYWPDATDEHGRFSGNGWEFVDRVMSTHGRWRATMHCNMNHSIEFDEGGMTARGEISNLTYLIPDDDGPWSLWLGRYLDRYERRGDEWRITHRVCVHEGTTTLPNAPMPMDPSVFRQGSVDRPAAGRPLGT